MADHGTGAEDSNLGWRARALNTCGVAAPKSSTIRGYGDNKAQVRNQIYPTKAQNIGAIRENSTCGGVGD